MEFADVAQEHLDTVYRFALHLCGDPHAAEDLTAQTFEKALKQWHRYDPSRSQPQTWLCAIARNACRDHWRLVQRRKEDLGANVPEEASSPEPGGLSESLRAALGVLTDSERQVVALRVVLNFSSAETGAVLGLRPTAVSSQLHRALGKLRKEVGNHAEH